MWRPTFFRILARAALVAGVTLPAMLMFLLRKGPYATWKSLFGLAGKRGGVGSLERDCHHYKSAQRTRWCGGDGGGSDSGSNTHISGAQVGLTHLQRC